jgi:hypothetical protein
MSGAIIACLGAIIGFAICGVGGWFVETARNPERLTFGQRLVFAGLLVVAATVTAGAWIDAVAIYFPPTPVVTECEGIISLEDTLAEHYCTVEDFNEDRVTVNGLIPPQFDVMLCDGDWVAVKHKHPLISPDGSKIYKTSRWMIQRPSP